MSSLYIQASMKRDQPFRAIIGPRRPDVVIVDGDMDQRTGKFCS